MEFKTYVTPSDFENLYGLNLSSILRSDQNESNQAERFINMVTVHLQNWIDANTFRRLDYDCLSDYQNRQWQLAILAQCYYTYKEGAKALGLSSGTDDEKGTVLDLGTLKEVEICPAAIDFLSNAGLFNLVMKNRPRVLRGFAFDAPVQREVTPTPEPQPCPGVIVGLTYTED